jgi:hypothetical protein
MKLEHLCPVCGYEMEASPKDYRICPSCGTEFGLHDANASIDELRQAWIEKGPKWWSATDPQPANWNPFQQLACLGLSSGPVVSTTAVVIITATTNDPAAPLTGGWLGSEERPWDQFVNRQSALGLP